MIGIMSDSHDSLEGIKKAVDVFNNAEVDLVVHAGDIISPFTSKEIQKLKCEFKAVFGNNDGEREGLRAHFKGICHLFDFQEFEVEEKKFALIHGTQEKLVDALVKSYKYDVVIKGHTHKLEVEKGKCMVINPGETCGYLSGKQTVILLDPQDLNYKPVIL